MPFSAQCFSSSPQFLICLMFSWSACWTMFYLGFPSKAHPPLLTENLPPSCQDVRVLGRACTHSIGQACKKKWTTKPRTALILQQITGSYGKWKHTRWKYSCWLVGLDNLRQTGKTFATKTEIWIDSEEDFRMLRVISTGAYYPNYWRIFITWASYFTTGTLCNGSLGQCHGNKPLFRSNIQS